MGVKKVEKVEEEGETGGKVKKMKVRMGALLEIE